MNFLLQFEWGETVYYYLMYDHYFIYSYIISHIL